MGKESASPMKSDRTRSVHILYYLLSVIYYLERLAGC